MKLLVIVGPTAVGKSRVALKVAEKVPLEIISADSMQVYRGMDIGTAKPTPEERRRVVHHLVDILDPDQEFSVADFKGEVETLIPEINRRGRIPALVGGTGLYIDAVLKGYIFPDLAKDQELRKKLREEAESRGSRHLHQKLAQVDPAAAKHIHPNDARRIIRALEVYQKTGKPLTALEGKRNGGQYDTLSFGLTMDRGTLYQRIEKRVEQMIQDGFLDEVTALYEAGCRADSVAMQALGYRELLDYLRGLVTWEETVRLIKRNTRRFAKRQYTWFRRNKEIRWIKLDEGKGVEDAAKEIVRAIASKWKIVYNG